MLASNPGLSPSQYLDVISGNDKTASFTEAMKSSDRSFGALAVATVLHDNRPRVTMESANIDVIRRRALSDLIYTLEEGAGAVIVSHSNDADVRTERRLGHINRLLHHGGSQLMSHNVPRHYVSSPSVRARVSNGLRQLLVSARDPLSTKSVPVRSGAPAHSGLKR